MKHEILKFDTPKQFPKDEILNENERIVRSWASVEVKDSQGDIIPVEELKRTLNTWFKRGATIIDSHTNRPVGRGLRWYEETHPETGKPGIVIEYQIFNDYSIDDDVWEEIKAGKRKGLSIGGRSLKEPVVEKDDYSGEMGKKLAGLELYEISTVENPANPFATNIAVNFLAKSQDMKPEDYKKELMKDLTKGFYVRDITKPFAGFRDFDECVTAQKARGHTDESAKRICGWLKYHTEDKKEEEKMSRLSKEIEDYVLAKDDEVNKEEYPWEQCMRDMKEEGHDEETAAKICAAIKNRTVHHKMMTENIDLNKALDLVIEKIKKDKDFDYLVTKLAEFEKEQSQSLETKSLNKSDSNIKNKELEESKMANNLKKEEYEEPVEQPAEPAEQEQPEDDLKARIDALEAKLDQVLAVIETIGKQEEEPEEKPEEEPEEKPAEEEEEPVEKEIGTKEVNPDPEGGEVKLPKAPAGESDEEEKISENKIDDIVEKKVKEMLKSDSVEKSTTPRPSQEQDVKKEKQNDDFVLSLLKKVKDGEMTIADMNREIKKSLQEQYEKELKAIFN